jgi:hypothetical protein
MFGSIVFLFGLFALVFLPLAVGLAGLMIGGLGVWSGFIWTLFSYYGPRSQDLDDDIRSQTEAEAEVGDPALNGPAARR